MLHKIVMWLIINDALEFEETKFLKSHYSTWDLQQVNAARKYEKNLMPMGIFMTQLFLFASEGIHMPIKM